MRWLLLALPMLTVVAACETTPNYECRGTIETRCRDVCYSRCDYYYGCYPVCYPQCYEICHDSRPNTGGSRGCTTNAECGADQLCDDRGVCSRYNPQSCVDDDGCALGERCLDNRCGLVCRTAADCPSGWLCERGVYVCTAQPRPPGERDAGTD
jgi:hypothetical protein